MHIQSYQWPSLNQCLISPLVVVMLCYFTNTDVSDVIYQICLRNLPLPLIMSRRHTAVAWKQLYNCVCRVSSLKANIITHYLLLLFSSFFKSEYKSWKGELSVKLGLSNLFKLNSAMVFGELLVWCFGEGENVLHMVTSWNPFGIYIDQIPRILISRFSAIHSIFRRDWSTHWTRTS